MPHVDGNLIRGRRRRLGIKLGEFAKRSGIKYKTLANIESGHSKGGVSIELVYRIAGGLGCDAEELLAGDEEAAAL